MRTEPLEWHFIGPLQSNKTRAVAERFHCVHTIERLKIARRLSEQRPAELPPLNVLHRGQRRRRRPSKSGVTPAAGRRAGPRGGGTAGAAPARTDGHSGAPRRLRRPTPALRRGCAPARGTCVHEGLGLDMLSMGMSADLEAAVAEGATMVRVGTAIFGPRRG
ncbi:MAG: alanine racemase [Arhodomonas sp.]|nr:alanine racemase [Arhodomonas sp.]